MDSQDEEGEHTEDDPDHQHLGWGPQGEVGEGGEHHRGKLVGVVVVFVSWGWWGFSKHITKV